MVGELKSPKLVMPGSMKQNLAEIGAGWPTGMLQRTGAVITPRLTPVLMEGLE